MCEFGSVASACIFLVSSLQRTGFAVAENNDMRDLI